METQTLGEEIAEAKRDLKEAKAEYRAEKERNPDDPKLDRLYQGMLNCQQLLHDLYEKEKRLLHQEQQALRETPADMVSILEKVAEQQGEILSLPSSSNLKRTAADDGTTQQKQQQKRTKATSSYVSTLSGEDWDVVPTDYWTVDMCCQWLRCAVELNEDGITSMRQWLQEDQERCHIFDLFTFVQYIPKLENIVASSSIMGINRVLKVSPPTVGPYAEPLKRWAECVSRGEEEIKTVEEYNTMKHTCGKVMVLRYSQLVQELDEADKNSFALMQQKLQQLCIDDKGGPAVAASEYDMEVRILPKHLKWPSFFVSKQNDAGNTHVLLRRIQPPVQDLENSATNALCDMSRPYNVIWTGAAGIGKSAYGNVVAERLVKNLMASHDEEPVSNSINLIAWRIDNYVYLFSKNVSGGIRIESRSVKSLKDVEELSMQVRRRRGVMIVELQEEDIHLPSMSCHILCSSSIKDIKSVFKEQIKQRCLSMYLLNCYEHWEVRAAANMLYALGDSLLGNERKTYVKTALNRISEVGGLPRYIFCDRRQFEFRMTEVNGISVDEHFMQHLNSSKYDTLSGNVKYFLTPHHTDHRSWQVICPEGTIKMTFLSLYCEILLMKIAAALGIDKIRTSLMWQPDWKVEESLLHTSLSANPIIVESELSIRQAEWFIDPGHNVKLSTQSTPADAGFVSSIPLYTKREFVQEGISQGSVTKNYKGNVLYCAVANIDMVVADCFMVDHDNKRVLLYQASISIARRHPFRETNIRNYIDAMELTDCDYKLCVVYVRGNHHGNDTGLTFIADDGKAGGLSEELKTRVETYVVRANYFKDRYVLLPGYSKSLSSKEEFFSLVVRSDRDTNEDKMIETSALLDLDITTKRIYDKITKNVVMQYLKSLDIQNGGKKEVVVHRFNEYLKRFNGVLIACQHGDAEQITAALRDFNSHLTAKEAIVTNIKRLPKSTRDKCCTVLGIDVDDISGLYETLKTAP